MNTTTFDLFIRVIKAAREGRFMHGNGAQWNIVDESGRKIVIDTTNNTVEFTPDYDGKPYTSHDLAYRLEDFLALSESSDDYSTDMEQHQAKAIVGQETANGNLMFTNGAQWYLRAKGTIIVIDLACVEIRGGYQREYRMVKYHAMSRHSAWKYVRAHGEIRATVTNDTRNFLGIR